MVSRRSHHPLSVSHPAPLSQNWASSFGVVGILVETGVFSRDSSLDQSDSCVISSGFLPGRRRIPLAHTTGARLCEGSAGRPLRGRVEIIMLRIRWRRTLEAGPDHQASPAGNVDGVPRKRNFRLKQHRKKLSAIGGEIVHRVRRHHSRVFSDWIDRREVLRRPSPGNTALKMFLELVRLLWSRGWEGVDVPVKMSASVSIYGKLAPFFDSECLARCAPQDESGC